MDELIKINETDGKRTVSARELHQKLEVKTRFNDWINRMIEYGFTEGVDYAVLKNECGSRDEKGHFVNTEYSVSIDMAKEICMIQRSEIGKKFRQYFIDCERALQNVVTRVQYITQKSEKEVDLARAEFLYKVGMESPVQTYRDICTALSVNIVAGEKCLPMPRAERKTFTATEIGELLGISRNRIGIIARENALKTPEYGEVIWDRARNGKQVQNFVYYQSGVDRFRELAK